MRTTSGFDAQNTVLRQRSPAREKLGILFGKDVIGDHRQTHVITQTAAERFDKRGLSRPHRPTDTNHRNMDEPAPPSHARCHKDVHPLVCIIRKELRAKESRLQPAVPHCVNVLDR